MPHLNRRISAALAGTAVAATAVLSGAPAATAAPPYRVVILSLHCDDKEELIDADYAKLLINGSAIWGPKKMVDGQTRSVNKSYAFNEQIKIKLYEDDDWWDTDDLLGTVVVNKSKVGRGEQYDDFTLKGAEYEITYKVVHNN